LISVTEALCLYVQFEEALASFRPAAVRERGECLPDDHAFHEQPSQVGENLQHRRLPRCGLPEEKVASTRAQFEIDQALMVSDS
jgi:hypothetical protein